MRSAILSVMGSAILSGYEECSLIEIQLVQVVVHSNEFFQSNSAGNHTIAYAYTILSQLKFIFMSFSLHARNVECLYISFAGVDTCRHDIILYQIIIDTSM